MKAIPGWHRPTEEVIPAKKSNENQSYKVKIENRLKLAAIRAEIVKMGKDLFKGDTQTMGDLAVGRTKSKIVKGSFEQAIDDIKTTRR